MLDDIPYSRFMQELRVVTKQLETEHRQQMQIGAFIGWQGLGSMGGKVPPFEKYLRQLGLNEPKAPMSDAQRAAEKAAAYSAGERVAQAFRGGVKQLSM